MGDMRTNPNSSMIIRPRWNSFLCRLSSRLSSPAPHRCALPRFHWRDAPARSPSRRSSPTWVPAAGSRTLGPWLETALYSGQWLETPPFVAEGVAGKPGLFLPGRTVYFCPFQPGGSGMTLYGYARVSVREPEDKNLDLQVERLVRAGCSLGNIRSEEASGARNDRGGLLELLDQVVEGDTLVVTPH